LYPIDFLLLKLAQYFYHESRLHNMKMLAKFNNRPKERKFAQSGHPALDFVHVHKGGFVYPAGLIRHYNISGVPLLALRKMTHWPFLIATFSRGD
jgi:hypothetical protein